MELYDAIFYRKSIEAYSSKSIAKFLIENVRELCNNITYLNPNLNIKAHLIDRGHLINFSTNNKIQIKAPHYILVMSNEVDDYLLNIGYAIQELTLELACLGLGTTWLKCPLDREEVEEFVNLESERGKSAEEIDHPQVIIAFGYPEEEEALFRSKHAIHDRHKMKNICSEYDEKWFNGLNALRVAPSYHNCQPWTLEKRIDGFDIFQNEYKKKNKDVLKYIEMSMGVALKHFEIGCKHDNIDIEFKKLDVSDMKKKTYFLSVIEKNCKNK